MWDAYDSNYQSHHLGSRHMVNPFFPILPLIRILLVYFITSFLIPLLSFPILFSFDNSNQAFVLSFFKSHPIFFFSYSNYIRCFQLLIILLIPTKRENRQTRPRKGVLKEVAKHGEALDAKKFLQTQRHVKKPSQFEFSLPSQTCNFLGLHTFHFSCLENSYCG